MSTRSVDLPAEARRKRSAGRAILAAGLAAGVLDILFAMGFYATRGVAASRVLQGVAAGLIGRDAAVKGGLATAALGLALHFLIAFGAAVVFYAASRKLRVLVERPWLSGAGYGVVVWLCMNLVVLPLSATPPAKFPPTFWMPMLAAHIVCVGWPIAWAVRRFGSKRI